MRRNVLNRQLGYKLVSAVKVEHNTQTKKEKKTSLQWPLSGVRGHFKCYLQVNNDNSQMSTCVLAYNSFYLVKWHTSRKISHFILCVKKSNAEHKMVVVWFRSDKSLTISCVLFTFKTVTKEAFKPKKITQGHTKMWNGGLNESHVNPQSERLSIGGQRLHSLDL